MGWATPRLDTWDSAQPYLFPADKANWTGASQGSLFQSPLPFLSWAVTLPRLSTDAASHSSGFGQCLFPEGQCGHNLPVLVLGMLRSVTGNKAELLLFLPEFVSCIGKQHLALRTCCVCPLVSPGISFPTQLLHLKSRPCDIYLIAVEDLRVSL